MIKVKNDLYGCPACMSQDIKSLIQKKLVSFLFPVPKEIIPKINREDISIFVCNFCSHVFQVNVDNKLIDVIYSEFYKHYNLDTSIEFQNIYRERTLNFIGKNTKNIHNNKYKMLDIGCGEGTYFPYFSKNEYSCYGFEPSEKHHLASMNNPDAVIMDIELPGEMDGIDAAGHRNSHPVHANRPPLRLQPTSERNPRLGLPAQTKRPLHGLGVAGDPGQCGRHGGSGP